MCVAPMAQQKPETPFEPLTCPKCPSGRMLWFMSDLRKNGTQIEHKFMCDKCGEVERITLPFVPPPSDPK